MQFRNLFLAACVAATASAAGNGTSNSTDIAPSVQNRLVQLEIGYLKTNLMLDQVANNIGDTTIDNVITTYLNTVQAEQDDLDGSQPVKPIPESTQMVLCQAFASLSTTGVRLNNAFVDNASEFDVDQRNQMQNGLTKVNDETGSFVINVASKSLSYCLKTVQTAEQAVSKSILDAAVALDPSA